MKRIGLPVIVFMLLLCGCATRSISNSGYNESGYHSGRGDNPFYKGELSEFDVLGIIMS